MISRLSQLKYFTCAFEQGAHGGDVAYHLLALIGHCFREGGSFDEILQVEEAFCLVKDSLSAVIVGLGSFVSSITFDDWDVESLSKEDLISFYEDRDCAELVYHLLSETFNSQGLDKPRFLVEFRRKLDRADDRILLMPALVEQLREIGALEPVTYTDRKVLLDRDWFWWLPPKEEHACHSARLRSGR